MLAFLEGSYLIYFWNVIESGCLPEVQPYSGVKEFLDHLSHEKGTLAAPLTLVKTGHQASGISPVWLLITIYSKILRIQANLINHLPFHLIDNSSNFLCNSNRTDPSMWQRSEILQEAHCLGCCLVHWSYTICITWGSNLFCGFKFLYTLILSVKVNESFPIL